MDTGLLDLDLLVNRIREPRSRTYFMDAVKAYKAGALRTSMTSVWVAVVYDIILKYRELRASGDAAADAFLRTWDEATREQDIRTLLDLEMTIVDSATYEVQLLNPVARLHLERLKKDRNLCAHPTFYTEENLFEPSVELVRLHLVNAIELVLSQAPLQGKAIFEQFDLDVRSVGFPTREAEVRDYVEQRYLSRTRSERIRNLGIVLAKSLLKGTPAEWDKERLKVLNALIAIRDRRAESWDHIAAEIVKIMNSMEPLVRSRAISFLSSFPDLWERIDESFRQALSATVEHVEAHWSTDYHALIGVRLPQFREQMLRVIRRLTMDQLRDALQVEVLIECWERALEFYRNSGGYRRSESNFATSCDRLRGGSMRTKWMICW